MPAPPPLEARLGNVSLTSIWGEHGQNTRLLKCAHQKPLVEAYRHTDTRDRIGDCIHVFLFIARHMPLAPFLPLLHKLLKPSFPTCLWEGEPPEQAIALTFDDGPHPDHTPRLLEVLDRYQVRVSFFWLGVCVDRFPAVARSVYERGHWLGLHGYTHQSFPQLTTPALQQSLGDTQKAIAQACQLDLAMVQQQVRDVRPPNGLFTPQTLRLLHQWQYRPVMWSVVPEDWVRPGVQCVVRRVLQQTRPGSVIVLHDGYCGGEEVAAIAAQILPALLDRGYQFVTIDQLWQHHPIARHRTGER